MLGPLHSFHSRKAASACGERERETTRFAITLYELKVVRSEIWRRTRENSIFANALLYISFLAPSSCSICASPNHFFSLREVQKEREEEEEIARIFFCPPFFWTGLLKGGETDDLRTRVYHHVKEGKGREAAKHLPPLLIYVHRRKRSCLLCLLLRPSSVRSRFFCLPAFWTPSLPSFPPPFTCPLLKVPGLLSSCPSLTWHAASFSSLALLWRFSPPSLPPAIASLSVSQPLHRRERERPSRRRRRQTSLSSSSSTRAWSLAPGERRTASPTTLASPPPPPLPPLLLLPVTSKNLGAVNVGGGSELAGL